MNSDTQSLAHDQAHSEATNDTSVNGRFASRR